MLVSAQEPKDFLVLGERSSMPEDYGADYLCFPRGNVVGIQRKECSDLVASANDDRMCRLMNQMKELHRGWLLVEGNFKWNHDGVATKRGCEGFTKARYDDILFSAQANNIWVATSNGIQDSIRAMRQIERFMTHEVNDHLFVRPKPRGLWGTWRDPDFGAHWWQTYQRVGIGAAGVLYAHLGIPARLTCTKKELQAVPGVGPKTVESIWRAFPDGS